MADKYPGLRRLLPVIATGPIDLRNAIRAALAFVDAPLDDRRIELHPDPGHIDVLRQHTGGWFGSAHEVIELLAEIAPR